MQITTINSWPVLLLGLVAAAATLYGLWYMLLKNYSSEAIFDAGEFFRSVACGFSAAIVGLIIVIAGGGIRITHHF